MLIVVCTLFVDDCFLQKKAASNLIYFLSQPFLVFIEIKIKICLSYIRIKKISKDFLLANYILYVVVFVHAHSEQLTHTHV